MSEEEKYIKCTNCRQNIPESKMFLHEGFCLKNNKLCPECDKVFLTTEFEEHLKTHNEKKKPPKPSLPEKKSITNQQKEKNSSINENKIKNPPKEQPPKKKPVIVSDSLGLKQCEYCLSMEEDIKTHYKTCKVKKMIDEENEKYYKDLEKRNKTDQALAKKLAKEKIMDISNDEKLAMSMQRKMQPIADTSNDEKMARELQQNFGNVNIDYGRDEELARRLEQEERQNQNMNFDNNDLGMSEMDDDLRRAIEESKKDYQ